MPLLDLSAELLLFIAEILESKGDLNAFSQTNRRLYSLLNNYLYRHNVRECNGSALIWAAQYGREGTARRLLEEGADIETTTYCGHTILSCAAYNGKEKVVKLLLKKGANVMAKNENGMTP